MEGKLLPVPDLPVGKDFESLFVDNPQPMWVFDEETLRFVEVNDAAIDLYGYSRKEFLAMKVTDIRPAEDVARFEAVLESGEVTHSSHDWRHRVKGGRIIYTDVRARRISFGGRPSILTLATDVTERRLLDERLSHQAFHDPLTGLANRALFRDRVEQAVARARRGMGRFAVLFIDLDNFKAINDTVGHTAGDAVLVEVASRLKAAIRPSDTAARLGGDEFGILIDLVAQESAAIRAARRIATNLNHPVEVGGDVWFVSGSIGIAYSGDTGDTVDAVMRSADVAMYDAKRRGRARFTVFEPPMHELVKERMALESDLRTAIAEGTLTVAYQPQVDLKSSRIVAVEALARWEHPERGSIAPAEFIPMAEDAGLIRDLDELVLRTAAAQLQAWGSAGIAEVTLAVNISGKELTARHPVDRIAAILRDVGLQPHQVELEVTESVALEAEHARETLAGLRRLGFRIAIDDFGVGYSMLGRLQDLAVDRLKIDRSFIDRIKFGEGEAPIVTAIIAMAHSLRLKVVAEGIETSEQLLFLRRNQCDFGQGYRLGRPAEPAAIEPLLRDRGISYQGLTGD